MTSMRYVIIAKNCAEMHAWCNSSTAAGFMICSGGKVATLETIETLPESGRWRVLIVHREADYLADCMQRLHQACGGKIRWWIHFGGNTALGFTKKEQEAEWKRICGFVLPTSARQYTLGATEAYAEWREIASSLGSIQQAVFTMASDADISGDGSDIHRALNSAWRLPDLVRTNPSVEVQMAVNTILFEVLGPLAVTCCGLAEVPDDQFDSYWEDAAESHIAPLPARLTGCIYADDNALAKVVCNRPRELGKIWREIRKLWPNTREKPIRFPLTSEGRLDLKQYTQHTDRKAFVSAFAKWHRELARRLTMFAAHVRKQKTE